jgi:ATP-dependent Clp protease ATP-binding subunit ClpB
MVQLEIEKEALKKETDKNSVERRDKIEKELSGLTEESTRLKAHWKQEKDLIDRISKTKKDIEETKSLAAQAEREGELGRAAELKYGRLVELARSLEEDQKGLVERQKGKKMLKEEVESEDVASVVSKWTGIPVSRMMEGEREKLLKMESVIKSRVVGQDDALRAVSNAVRRARAGLQDVNRPIGSFIFLGPTGVGKTETSRALAEFLFDDEKAMVRLDMSEFMEKHAVARLIGAPPGYVGYEEGGYLTEAVRRRPYAVVLFDEIEKAHPEVFNILLQILDDGRLTDGQGRTVDFKNTLIIMTSNLGSQYLTGLEEKDYEEISSRVMGVLKDSFKPEFLNRIDDTIIFHPLTREHMKAILDIQLKRLGKLLEEKKIKLKLTDNAKSYLAETGYDPAFGARALKRLIQREVQDPLAMKILDGEFNEDDTVLVDARDGKLTFGKGAPKAGAVKEIKERKEKKEKKVL